MRIIYYWPDGVWCDATDLHYMTHKSDDYATFEVSYEVDELTIDQSVQFKIRSNNGHYL